MVPWNGLELRSRLFGSLTEPRGCLRQGITTLVKYQGAQRWLLLNLFLNKGHLSWRIKCFEVTPIPLHGHLHRWVMRLNSRIKRVAFKSLKMRIWIQRFFQNFFLESGRSYHLFAHWFVTLIDYSGCSAECLRIFSKSSRIIHKFIVNHSIFLPVWNYLIPCFAIHSLTWVSYGLRRHARRMIHSKRRKLLPGLNSLYCVHF